MSTLPQEIGRTERALTALLERDLLAGSPLPTSADWVAVNVLQRLDSPDAPAWAARLAEELSWAPADAFAIVARLREAQVVVETPQGLTLSADAAVFVDWARGVSARVASELDRRVSPVDLAATKRVLAVVRATVGGIRNGAITLV